MLYLSEKLKASDTLKYHRRALALERAWREAPAGPWPAETRPYAVLLAALYYFLGPSPVWAALVNAFCAGLLALLARALALGLGQPPARAAGLALLVALWPPTLAWGLLPLRELLSHVLSLGLLGGILALAAPGREASGAARGWRMAAAGLGLLACAYLGVTLRPYLERFFAPFALACLGLGLYRLGKGRPAAAVSALLATLLLLAGGYLGVVRPAHLAALWGRVDPAQLAPGDPLWTSDRELGGRTLANYLASQLRPWRVAGEMEGRRGDFVVEGGRTLEADPPPENAPAAPAAGRDPGFRTPDRGDQPPPSLATRAERALEGLDNVFLRPRPCENLFGGGWPVRAAVAGLQPCGTCSCRGSRPGRFSGGGNAPLAAGLVLALGLGLGLAMGYVAVNLGTLFRLRDQAMLPLILLWDPAPYAWLARRLGLARRPGLPPAGAAG